MGDLLNILEVLLVVPGLLLEELAVGDLAIQVLPLLPAAIAPRQTLAHLVQAFAQLLKLLEAEGVVVDLLLLELILHFHLRVPFVFDAVFLLVHIFAVYVAQNCRCSLAQALQGPFLHFLDVLRLRLLAPPRLH